MALKKPVKILIIIVLILAGLYGAYLTLFYNVSPDVRLEAATAVYEKCLEDGKDKEICQENFIRNAQTSPSLLKEKIIDETISTEEKYSALKGFHKMNRALNDFLDMKEAEFYFSILDNNNESRENLKYRALVCLFRTSTEDETAKIFQKRVLELSTMTFDELTSIGGLGQADPRDERMIDNLMELFKDEKPGISINAGYALTGVGLKMKERIPQLLEIALNKNRPMPVRATAIAIMGDLLKNYDVKDERIIETLELLLEDGDDKIRQITNSILESLGSLE